MKITRCEAWPVRLDLEEPFTIAYMTVDHAVNWFLRVETDTGICGYGCSAHDEEVTGENKETLREALNGIVIPILQGQNLDYLERILTELQTALSDQPTAAASADMALMDIMARHAGMPLYRMLGGYRDSIPTSVTLGIQSIEDTVKKALEWQDRGFRILKLKGGTDVEGDIEKVRRVREAVGPEMELRFDANQGYSVTDALKFAGAVSTDRVGGLKGIEFIEQPCSKNDPGAFMAVQKGSGGKPPLMADESVLGPEDVLELACAGGVDLYNIKLTKTGGIRRAIHFDAVAGAAGAATMVGCMDEAGLGVAAGLHFALSSANVAYADLDGHLEFTNDPSAEALILRNGVLFPHDKPGLGYDP